MTNFFKRQLIFNADCNQMNKRFIQSIVFIFALVHGASSYAVQFGQEKIPMHNGLPAWVEFDGQKWHPTQLLARLRDANQNEAATKILNESGMVVVREFKLVPGLVSIGLNERQSAKARGWSREALIGSLKKRHKILTNSKLFLYIEFDGIVFADAAPSDKAYQDGRLWGLHNIGQDGGLDDADIDAPQAWDLSTGNKATIVAICDTGIRYTHEDLRDQMWINEDEIAGNGVDDDGDGFVDNIYGADTINNDGDPMDGHGHGSHCAGTIGASANDSAPHVGVAWNVSLMAVKCLSDWGGGSTAAVMGSVDFAANNGASVLNLSLGGGAFSQAFLDIIVAAADANVILACAAGNSGSDNDSSPQYPSSYDVENVIAVAATDRNDNMANFSSYGLESVDLGAPGVAIYSCTSSSDSSYDSWDGTSMATPHVAGVLALMRSLEPDWAYLQIREKLFAATDPIPPLDGKVTTGGRLNAFKAIEGMGSGDGSGLIPDGIMEVGIMPPSGSILLAGSSTNLFVTVFDALPVNNAIVSSVVELNNNIETYFFNNSGDEPDVVKDDNIYSNAIQLPKQGGKMKMSLMIEAENKQPYMRVVSYDVVPIPENDDFESAYKISGSSGSVEGYNTFATLQANEPDHASSPLQQGSLWWNWSPPVDGKMYADVAGSDSLTTLAVYVGTDLESAVRLVDNSPIDGERPDFVQWEGRRGRTYHIAVASLTESQRGYLRLRTGVNGSPDVNPPIVRINSPSNGMVMVTNRVELAGIAIDPKPNASGIKEVIIVQNKQSGVSVEGRENWNLNVVLAKGINQFDVYALDYNGNLSDPARLVIDHRPPEVPNDHFVNAMSLNHDVFWGDGSRVQFAVTQPITDLKKISITVDGVNLPDGEVKVSDLNDRYILFESPPEKGTVIRVFHKLWISPLQNTTQATREEGEPLHAGNEGSGSIWYSFKAPTDGLLSVSTINASFDTVLGMYMGDRVDRLSLVTFNDEDPALKEMEDNPGLSRIDQALEGGMEVYIALDGFAGARGAVSLLSEFEAGPIHRLSVSANNGGKMVSALTQPFNDEDGRYTLFAHNGLARLEVRPDGGNVFEGWQGSLNSMDNPLDLIVTENIKVMANFGPISLSENFETGDLGHLQWKAIGNADWFVQAKVTSGSNFAAQSGSIGDGQSTSLILEEDFTGGEGSFEVRVNSERTWDKLVFLVDGRKILEWSGIQEWGKYSFNITPGKHLLEWRYEKDFGNSFGEDTAWLDNIDLPLRIGASLALEKNGDAARLRLWGRPGHRYDIEVSTDFSGWVKWDSVFIDSEGVKLLEKEIGLNASATRFFRAVAP